jgi:hypothetical protein
MRRGDITFSPLLVVADHEPFEAIWVAHGDWSCGVVRVEGCLLSDSTNTGRDLQQEIRTSERHRDERQSREYEQDKEKEATGNTSFICDRTSAGS